MRSFREALYRLMLTPTFAAGLCVVLVAIMAYGTTQTHLLFSGGVGPACATASCFTAAPHVAGGVPLQASAQPDRGAGRPRSGSGIGPGLRGGGGNAIAGLQPRPQAGAIPPATGGDAAPAAPGAPWVPVIISYQTLRSWRGAFLAAITITSRAKGAIRDWRLWLRYPSNRIDRVWGARWLPASEQQSYAGLIASQPGQELRPGASARIVFWAHGTAGTPSGCVFDRVRCRYSGES